MNTFYEFDIEVENVKQKELGIENSIDSKAYVNLMDITAIYESRPDGSDEKTQTVILFKSGV